MISPILQRVELLLSQSRFPEAKELLQTHLAENPEDFFAQFYLATIQLQLGEKQIARQMTEKLLLEEPEAYPVMALAVDVELADEKLDKAEDLARALMGLYPLEAGSFLKMASVKLQQRNYDRALEAANQALALDPENIDALNLKIMIGGLLGNEDTQQAIEEALHIDPESASTIANHGMQLLREGKVQQALERLKYALSLDPTNSLARYAMAQALKARFWPYRMFLKYGEFSARLSGQSSWAIIIGAYVVYRILAKVANEYEALAPFLYPIIILIASLFLLTWILEPLMNLYLLSNPYGRLLLDDDEKKMARYTGGSLGVALLSFALYFALSLETFLMLGVLGVACMIPLGTFLKPTKSKNRRQLTYFTVAVILSGVVGILLNQEMLLFGAFFGIFIYQWIINGIMIKENARIFGS